MPLHAEPLIDYRLIQAVTDYLQTHDARIFPFTANFDDEKRAAFDRDLRIGLSDLTESGSKRGTSSVGYIVSDRRLHVIVREWLDADGEWPKGQDPYNPQGVASVLHPEAEEQSRQSTVASAAATVDDSLLVEEALAYEDSLGNASATDLSDAVLVDGGETDGTPTEIADADDDLLAADVEALEEVDAVGAEPLADEVVIVAEEILIVDSVHAETGVEEVLIVEETFVADAGDETLDSAVSDGDSLDTAGSVAADGGDFQDELDAASNESELMDYSVADEQEGSNVASSNIEPSAAHTAVAGEPPFEVQAESEMMTAGSADTAATRSSKLPTEGEGSAWVAGDGTRDVPAGFPIKGNADSGIYHPLESSGYNNTIAEIYFRDSETAEQFGYRLPKGMAGVQLGASAAEAARSQAEASTDAAVEEEPAVKRSNKLPTDGEGTHWIPGDGGEEAPAEFPIKGNANSGIYHPHESPSYGVTIAEIYFRDSKTAEEFGYRLPKNLAHLSQHLGDKAADAADDANDKDR